MKWCITHPSLTYSGPHATNSPFDTVELSAFLCFVLLLKVESGKRA